MEDSRDRRRMFAAIRAGNRSRFARICDEFLSMNTLYIHTLVRRASSLAREQLGEFVPKCRRGEHSLCVREQESIVRYPAKPDALPRLIDARL